MADLQRKKKLVEEDEGGRWLVLASEGAVKGDMDNDDEIRLWISSQVETSSTGLLIPLLPEAI